MVFYMEIKMQFVDINGKTLPEIIKEYEEKINSLYETTKKRTVYTSTQGFDSINTMYQLSDLNEQEGIDTGSIIYFSENGWLAIARNIDKTIGSYYVINPVQIKGEKGTDGAKGKEIVTVTIAGTKVEDDTTVTTNRILYNDDSHTLFSVYAKNGTDGTNGKSVTNAHTVSHSVVGDETVTNVEFVIDGVTPNPTVEIHAQNGANGIAEVPYVEIVFSSTTTVNISKEQFEILLHNKNAYAVVYSNSNKTSWAIYTQSNSVEVSGVLEQVELYNTYGNSHPEFKRLFVYKSSNVYKAALTPLVKDPMYRHFIIISSSPNSVIVFDGISYSNREISSSQDFRDAFGDSYRAANGLFNVSGEHTNVVYLQAFSGHFSIFSLDVNNSGQLSNNSLNTGEYSINDTVTEV